MLFAGTIIYFDIKKIDKVKTTIAKYKNIEIFVTDDNIGKMVITIEFNTDKELEEIEAQLLKEEGIIDVIHHAFNFEEEAEKLAKGEIKIELDEFFKMRDSNKERK